MKLSEENVENIEAQLQNLRIFIAVADMSSIARAAQSIHRAPSAISRSIIELEKGIGFPLFERKPRGMLINEYGRAVLLRACRIQDEITAAAEAITRERSSVPPGTVAALASRLFNHRKLRLIESLAAFGSMAAAASQLGITAAGASMALSRIEGGLGLPLFERRVQGLVPLEVADRLVTCAKRVFAELRHLRSDIAMISGSAAGSVVIGTSPLGRTYVIPRAISASLAGCPGLQIITIDSPYDVLIQGLRVGEVDVVIGVARDKDLDQGIICKPLFTDMLAVLVRAGHPLCGRTSLTAEEIANSQWILPRANTVARIMADKYFFDQGGVPPVPSVETGDLAVIRETLLTSDLVAISSSHQMLFELNQGLLVKLPMKLSYTSRRVDLILRDGAMLSPAADVVLNAIEAQVAQLGAATSQH